jgi:hypothetical protein
MERLQAKIDELCGVGPNANGEGGGMNGLAAIVFGVIVLFLYFLPAADRARQAPAQYRLNQSLPRLDIDRMGGNARMGACGNGTNHTCWCEFPDMRMQIATS